MKKNTAISVISKPGENEENAGFSVTSDGLFQDSPWMEFEDSYIQLLSGGGYTKITEGHCQMAC